MTLRTVERRLTVLRPLCTVAPVVGADGTMPKKKEPSVGGLEESLKELESLVERLEAGDLPLEEALAQFERGIKLTRSCQTILKDAEQKVEILLKKTEQAEPEPFEPDGGQ